MAGDGHLRLSDAERESAAAELGEHYAQGRLTTDEHAERLDRIWAAKARSELGPIFADLPSGLSHVGRSASPSYGAERFAAAQRGWQGGRRQMSAFTWMLPWVLRVLVMVALAIFVVSHLPVLLLVVAAWFLLFRRGHHRPHRVRW